MQLVSPAFVVTAAVIGAHRSRNPPQSCVRRPSRSDAVAIIRLGSENVVKEASEPMEGEQLLFGRSTSCALHTDGDSQGAAALISGKPARLSPLSVCSFLPEEQPSRLGARRAQYSLPEEGNPFSGNRGLWASLEEE
ncbi:hypothetical protein NDU88_005432 [Pleurodeles waltl]|uniref:Secreted protein n=1 Tax=Pleurodeles waltl TaxID=8319 RepID=A0AAV7NQ95_PLEWA|nr:hypothetical protein NDU88_005432 [Pleurodeles waltl]